METDLTPRGGYRENAGRKSAFPGKILDKPFFMDFTPKGRRELQHLVTRTGLSRNDVIGHLALRHADDLAFEEEGVAFPGKMAEDVMSIRLDRQAGAKLAAARVRTGKSYSDLGEALIRWFGKAEKVFPVLPGADPPRRRRSRSRGRRSR